MTRQVHYFYEGESEKTLLSHLKICKLIKAGKLKKYNLWQDEIKKISRLVNKKDEIFFIIDTDTTTCKDIFIENIRQLKFYNNACLIIQHKNLEDELCFSCGKTNTKNLFDDFYKVTNAQEFKSKLIREGNLNKKLTDNKFNFDRLWSRVESFDVFLEKNNLSVNTKCNINP